MKVTLKELSEYVGPKTEIEVCEKWLRLVGYNTKCVKEEAPPQNQVVEFIKKLGPKKHKDVVVELNNNGFKTKKNRSFSEGTLRYYLKEQGYENVFQVQNENPATKESSRGIDFSITKFEK